MPGPPSRFTDKTIILISGNSGSGKSTLSKFLTKKTHGTVHICTDKLVMPKVIERYHGSINDSLYDRAMSFLRHFRDPQKHVPTVVHELDESFLVQVIIAHIEKEFNKNDHLKCAIVEGYTLTVSDISHRVAKKLKHRDYRVWISESFNSD